jgi:hypothetical protein
MESDDDVTIRTAGTGRRTGGRPGRMPGSGAHPEGIVRAAVWRGTVVIGAPRRLDADAAKARDGICAMPRLSAARAHDRRRAREGK